MELNDLNKIQRSGSLNKLLGTRSGFDLDLFKKLTSKLQVN